MNKSASFRVTLPVIFKAQEEGGKRYIIGEASGPEIDATNERMSPEAIARFAKQIEDMVKAGEPLVYRDAHAPDGVLRDLGEVVECSIDERFHLTIKVLLDNDNAAADFLWKKVKQGRKWGMSIAGMVRDYVDEYLAEAGRVIRTYKDVVLTEISNTSRPAWTPSFGTVLAKAIDEANAASSDPVEANVGDTLQTGEAAKADAAPEIDINGSLGDDEPQDETPAGMAAKADDDAETEDTTEKADDAEAAPEAAEDDVEKGRVAETAISSSYAIASLTSLLSNETDEGRQNDLRAAITALQSVQSSAVAAVGTDADQPSQGWSDDSQNESDLEKAGRAISAERGKKLLSMFNDLKAFLEENGVLENSPAKSDSADAEPDLVKSLSDANATLETTVEELRRALDEKTAEAERLANTTSAVPPIVRHVDESVELAKAVENLSPSEKIAVGLALARR